MNENIKNGLDAAGAEMQATIRYFTDSTLVPILAIVVGVILLILIATGYMRWKQGEDFNKIVTGGIACIVIIALILSFPSWGWTMLGMG